MKKCFISFILLEVLVFFVVTNFIGFGNTVLLTILCSFFGIWIINQSKSDIKFFDDNISVSLTTICNDDIAKYISGVLLVFPGFISDLLGIFLFFKLTRKVLKWATFRLLQEDR